MAKFDIQTSVRINLEVEVTVSAIDSCPDRPGKGEQCTQPGCPFQSPADEHTDCCHRSRAERRLEHRSLVPRECYLRTVRKSHSSPAPRLLLQWNRFLHQAWPCRPQQSHVRTSLIPDLRLTPKNLTQHGIVSYCSPPNESPLYRMFLLPVSSNEEWFQLISRMSPTHTSFTGTAL